MGVPAVLTDIRGCREVVVDGQNGRLVPPGDPRRLADAILELVTDRQAATKMGEKGLEIAQEKFDQRHVFQKVADMYGKLLRAKGLELPTSAQRMGAKDVG
jgi:glycosyltransferase involved in cell wall biosynthesis